MANNELSIDCILYIGTLFEKWCNLLSKEDINELHKKYALAPDAVVMIEKTYRKRQKCIGEAVRLIYAIVEAEGPDITSMNFNNAMRYLLVSMDCVKYALDVDFARADNVIAEMKEQYILKR